MLGFSGTRKWVYPQYVNGRFQRLHRWSGRVLHLVLFLTPWIMIGGHPAVRVDLPDRRVYFLGTIFTASDGYLMTLLGLLAAFSLFFFTSLFGRLWCGYLCPQTVFLEEWIRPIERLWEGDRGRRMQLDKAPWNARKVAIKVGKWASFATVAVLVSMGFMAWFAGARELFTGQGGAVEYALVGIFATGWFVDFVWFREQLCNYVCPYARFQGALMDEESLMVTYDVARGEPGRGDKQAAKEHGACIDCNKCVVVCPQGIDIREGFQLECITCGRCIDACDQVMGKLGHPSLVSYGTIAKTQGRQARYIRPRTVVYATLLSALSAALVAAAILHHETELTVNRAPGTLFQVDADGHVRNTFLVRVANNAANGTQHYVFGVEGLDGAELVANPLDLASTESATVPLVVRLPVEAADRTIPFVVTVTSNGERVTHEATFKGPGEITPTAIDGS